MFQTVSLGGFFLLFVASRLLHVALIDPARLLSGEELYRGTLLASPRPFRGSVLVRQRAVIEPGQRPRAGVRVAARSFGAATVPPRRRGIPADRLTSSTTRPGPRQPS